MLALVLFAVTLDAQMLPLLQDLAIRGAQQVEEQEVAAFIVRNDDGTLRSVFWPPVPDRREQRYTGTIPAGTIAIAHTHPFYAYEPSRGDRELAKRTGLSVYVITRSKVYVATPTGEDVALIKSGDWIRWTKPMEAQAAHR